MMNTTCIVFLVNQLSIRFAIDANGTKLRTDYYINPMSAVVPQAANEQGASSATNLRHTWTDYCGNFIYKDDTIKQTVCCGILQA